MKKVLWNSLDHLNYIYQFFQKHLKVRNNFLINLSPINFSKLLDLLIIKPKLIVTALITTKDVSDFEQFPTMWSYVEVITFKSVWKALMYMCTYIRCVQIMFFWKWRMHIHMYVRMLLVNKWPNYYHWNIAYIHISVLTCMYLLKQNLGM